MNINECTLFIDQLELDRIAQLRSFRNQQSLLQLSPPTQSMAALKPHPASAPRSTLHGSTEHKTSSLRLDESMQGGPPAAAAEAVPATVSVPPPGPRWPLITKIVLFRASNADLIHNYRRFFTTVSGSCALSMPEAVCNSPSPQGLQRRVGHHCAAAGGAGGLHRLAARHRGRGEAVQLLPARTTPHAEPHAHTHTRTNARTRVRARAPTRTV